MPEVVEIKKFADFIRRRLLGKPITSIRILKGRYKTHGPFSGYTSLHKKLPLKIVAVNTKGKFIYITFENGYILLSTMGLFGGYVYKRQDKFVFPNVLDYVTKDSLKLYRKIALNNLNVEFMSDQGTLYYYDALSFGTLRVLYKRDRVTELTKKLNTIGPDIMDENTTSELFDSRIRRNSNMGKPIGVVLLNQKNISGVGNYLRADVLWLAKISPFRLVENISKSEMRNIFDRLKELTWSSYNYKLGERLGILNSQTMIPSKYKRNFFVYNETKDLYGNDVVKEELYEGSQKRFIFWAPSVQK